MQTVFLHGFLGQPSDWHAVTNRLSECECDAIELPEANTWKTALMSLLDILPVRCNLVGYSMGARLALGCALEAPHRVSRLCLISGNPGLDETARSLRKTHDQRVAAKILNTDYAQFLHDWYRQPLFAAAPASMRSKWVQRALALDRHRQAELLLALSISGQPDYRPRLSELRMPTQLIVGTRDSKYVEIAASMVEQAPQLRLQMVDAGHAVPRENPIELANLLCRFLMAVNPSTETSRTGLNK